MAVADPLANFLDHLGNRNVKRSGNGYSTRCPAHDDRQSSLSFRSGDDGRVLVKCFAGCEPERIVSALGMKMADLFPPKERTIKRNGDRKGGEGGVSPPRNTATPQHDGLTLARYSEAKRLDADRLRAFGLSDLTYDGNPAVRMPYLDEAGNEAAVRFRVRLDKSADGDRFKWRKGSKLCLYGLDRFSLAHECGYIVLVEGESDCHTLWTHGEPALGIPGATNWNEARDAPMLADFPTIFVVVEPDKGGEAVLTRLRTSAIRDRVQLVTLAAPHKDPSALHCSDPEQFAARWEAAKADAVPLAERLDAEEREEAEVVWAACQDLAREPDILTRAAETVAALGVAGERLAVMLVYLAMVSRLLPKPVNVAVKGPSSAGKSFLVEQTLRLFPDETYYALTAMSERALAYSNEPIAHRMLVLYEAAGQTGDMGSYLMRSLLSEGRIRYETVTKTKDGLQAQLIEREGPTGLIVTTTATRLHPENETRMVSFTVSDTPEQTRDILLALAVGPAPIPDLAPWHALQQWLALGERRVSIPFAPALADLVPPKAVRLRRDFGLLLNLVRAHALLHRASRETDQEGAILATLDDYEAARTLVEPLIAAGVDATVPATMRDTVAAVRTLCPGPDDSASVVAIAKVLGLDKGAASRRVSAARERGYLVNHETRKGQPAKIGLGEALPEDTPILPKVDAVALAMREKGQGDNPSEFDCNTATHPKKPYNHAEKTVAETDATVVQPRNGPAASVVGVAAVAGPLHQPLQRGFPHNHAENEGGVAVLQAESGGNIPPPAAQAPHLRIVQPAEPTLPEPDPREVAEMVEYLRGEPLEELRAWREEVDATPDPFLPHELAALHIVERERASELEGVA